MKYYSPNKKQFVSSREIDLFLSQLHMICRKHKMCIVTTNPKFPLVVEPYSAQKAKHMLGNVHNNLVDKQIPQKKKSEKKKDNDKNS